MTDINKAFGKVFTAHALYHNPQLPAIDTSLQPLSTDEAIAKIKALVVESIKDEVPEKYDPNLSKELRNIKLEERRWLNMRNKLRGEIRSIFE